MAPAFLIRASLTSLFLSLCPACALDEFRLTEAGIDVDAAAPLGSTPAEAEGEEQACSPGAFRCDPAAPQRLQVCDPLTSTGWAVKETCQSAEACAPELGRCRTCEPGEHRCNSWLLEECNQDGTDWVQLAPCPSPERCDSRSVQCSACVSGEAYCSGRELLSCNANRDGYDRTVCESADLCNVASMSCRACFPGEVQCNMNELVRCTEDAKWELVEGCDSAAQCEASMQRLFDDPEAPVECIEPACEPGTFSCSEHDGRTLLGCPPDASGWVEIDRCATPEACDAEAGQCTPPTCTPGSYRCSGTALQLCSGDGGRWETQRNCPAAELCNTAQRTCVPCEPGELQCNAHELQRCTEAATWETLAVCASTALCDVESEQAKRGECVEPTCTEQEYRCVERRLEVCNTGLDGFSEVTSCESEQACNPVDGRCDVLGCEAPEAYRCRGQFLEFCPEDRRGWEMVKTCETGSICDLGILDCADQCPSDRFRCNGLVPEECVMAEDGTISWRASAAPCATAGLCMATAENASCTAPACGGTLATFRCNPSQPQTVQRCNAARTGWETDRTCGAGTICDPGPTQRGPAQCDVCQGGVHSCDGEVLRRCELDGQSQTALQTCRAAEYCVASGTSGHCLVCDPGDTACDGAALTVCSQDRRSWVDPQACPAQFGCHATPDLQDYCNVCAAPSEARCNGTTLDTCDAAQRTITQQTACEFGCQPVIAQPDYCRQCQPSTAECSTMAEGQRLVCNAVGVWETQTCANGSDCFDAGMADYCGSCEPGTFSCLSSTQRQECSSGGTPGSVTTCPSSSPVCLPATGGCVQCTPGMAARCSGASGTSGRETCSDAGVWQAANCSGSTPACHEGECKACYPGDSICRGNDPGGRDLCSGTGVWQASNCSAATVCWEGDCVECNPASAEPRCTSSGGAGREICVAGEWTAENCGSGLLCVDGACVECDPASQSAQCVASEGASARRVCDGGVWERDDCEEPTPLCTAGGQCVCAEGGTRCSTSGVRQTCTGGVWVNAPCTASYCQDGACVECRDAADCNPDFPACVDGACECEAGSERCSETGAHQVCTGTAWNPVPCMGETPLCDAATGACVCQEGAKRCQSGNAQVCTGGTWQARASDPQCVACMTSAQCGGTEPICDGIECVACADDCPAGVCAASGACVECTQGDVSECLPSEPLCSAENLCVECLTNQDCDPQAPICDDGACRGCEAPAECPLGCRADGRCASCAVNGDCSGTTPVCAEGECRACQPGECGGNICNAQTGACEPCSTSNCSGVCVEGSCVPCSEPGDAGGGVPCPSGTCVAGVCQQ